MESGILPEPIRDRDNRKAVRAHGDYDTEYARLTQKARDLNGGIMKRKMEIAKDALSICVVNHGGGGHWNGHKGIKTLQQFADDSGINRKTLNNYTRIYKEIVKELPDGVYQDHHYPFASRAMDKISSIPKGERTPSKALELFEDEKGRKGSTSRIRRSAKILVTLKNHFAEIDWEKCKPEEVSEIVDLFEECNTVLYGGEEESEEELSEDCIAVIGDDFNIDLNELVKTRLLIQANSGGGKSHALRKIIKECYGKLPVVVFDIEGEFGDIENEYYAEDDGEPVAGVIREGLSVRVDLSDMAPEDRKAVVLDCCESLMSITPEECIEALVIIDEAHLFAPQGGDKEAKECRRAVTDLASRGRKRGLSLVLSTQRISKLHKDVAAECVNKMVGRTNLNLDVRRACEELNISCKENAGTLKSMSPGEFFVFGPAISTEVEVRTVYE